MRTASPPRADRLGSNTSKLEPSEMVMLHDDRTQPREATATSFSTHQSGDPYTALRRNLLSPQRVRELSHLKPARALFDALRCWATIMVASALVAKWPMVWTILLAATVVGSRYYALLIIGHDGLHRRVFDNPKYNDLFSDLMVFGAIGAITRFNNRNHMLHHLRLSTEFDPDRHKHGCHNKTTPAALIGFLTGATSILPSVLNVFVRRARPPSEQGKPEIHARYTLRDIPILLGWQAALIAGLTYSIGFWAWPVLWLLPVYVLLAGGPNRANLSRPPKIGAVCGASRESGSKAARRKQGSV